MGFSFEFLLVLLLLLVPLYYAIPGSWQPGLLLFISVAFYASFVPWHLAVAISLVFLTWAGALWTTHGGGRRMAPAMVITFLLLALLAVFKYGPALEGMVHQGGDMSDALLIIMPLGMSYIVFRCIGYVIDVQRGTVPAERRIDHLALFVLFFPHVMAGPIERYGAFRENIRNRYAFDPGTVYDGLRMIAWGMFLKFAVADNLASTVETIYTSGTIGGVPLIVATYFYAFQIYADFAGYTCMAIGAAKLFSYRSTPNFRQPYFAQSITEFWTRWHISLSSWLRDYVFLPLAYGAHRRLAGVALRPRTRDSIVYAVAVIATMAICGIWHGVGLAFLCWGLLHGLYMVAGALRKHVLKRRHARGTGHAAPLRVFLRRVTVFHLVCISWVLFRSASLDAAGAVFERMTRLGTSIAAIGQGTGTLGIIRNIGLIILLITIESIQQRHSIRDWLAQRAPVYRWALYVIAIVAIELLSRTAQETKFLYALY